MIILPLTLGAMLLALVLRFGATGLTRLAASPLRGGPVVLVACLAQVAGVLTQQHRLPLQVATCLLLGLFCWLNRRRAGVLLASAGIGLNMLVMLVNGGTMPMNPEALATLNGTTAPSGSLLLVSKNRVLDDSAARLPWLGDRLLLPGPAARLAAWSIGDVLLLAGVATFMWTTMKGSNDDQGYLWNEAASC